MYGEIKIGNTTVPMLAMASTDIYYKRIFHEDPLKIQMEAYKNEDMAAQVDMTMKLGFVMAKFYQLKTASKMRELNEDDYVDWLDQFGREELVDALGDIRSIYEGQQIGTSEAKKSKDD